MTSAASPAATLLVVDDIQDNRTLLRRRFERLGYRIVEADSGEAALDLIAKGGIDLVLLDVVMPGMDGFEVLRLIRQTHSIEALPVIMVTAQAQSQNVVEALELGANDYVTKPVDFAIAKARVAAHVGRKRAEDRNREAQADLNETVLRLEEALKRADAAAIAKAEFLSNMSHELRTPLNGIIGLAVVLAKDCVDAKAKDRIEMVKGSAAALEQLLSDILDAAKLSRNDIKLEIGHFDPSQALRDVADVFLPAAVAKNLSLDVRAPATAGVRVVGDGRRVRQILTNLIGNAVKFTETGAVTCSLGVLEHAVEFEIRDTGIGFDPANASLLFERFRQEDQSSTRRFGGAGLGLALSQDLARLMGGFIAAEGVLGQGAVFRFRLPLVSAVALRQADTVDLSPLGIAQA